MCKTKRERECSQISTARLTARSYTENVRRHMQVSFSGGGRGGITQQRACLLYRVVQHHQRPWAVAAVHIHTWCDPSFQNNGFVNFCFVSWLDVNGVKKCFFQYQKKCLGGRKNRLFEKKNGPTLR